MYNEGVTVSVISFWMVVKSCTALVVKSCTGVMLHSPSSQTILVSFPSSLYQTSGSSITEALWNTKIQKSFKPQCRSAKYKN